MFTTYGCKISGYEKEACLNLGFNCHTKRYWGCEYNGKDIGVVNITDSTWGEGGRAC
jgi:hypothetical protein